MKIVFLIIFIISSIIHLYASYKKDSKMRAYSKGFIVSSLLGWYCASVQSPLLIVILALFFSWLGDVLLIPKGVKWFTCGGIAFIISHICFVLAYYPQVNFSKIPLIIIFLSAAIYLIAVILVFKNLKPHLPKILFYPMFVYLMINGTMNCFAFYQLLSIPCVGTIITFIGATQFFTSDSILFNVRFNKQTKFKSHFPVMLTYIIAEFLIVLGIMLTN